jgi:peptide chain release factor subunit 1
VEFFNRIGESANLAFSQIEDLQGILVGGPSPTKEDFMKGPFLSNDLKSKVIDLFDITYTDEDGLRELVNAAKEALSDFSVMTEKNVVASFLQEVAKDGMATYGIAEIISMLDMGAVQTLLISEGLKKKVVAFHCDNCDQDHQRIVDDAEAFQTRGECPACSRSVAVEKVRDLDDVLIEKAENSNTDVQLISTDTEEGKQLVMAFGGLGAILRYKP